MNEYIQVITTTPNRELADTIAVVDQKLVTLIPYENESPATISTV